MIYNVQWLRLSIFKRHKFVFALQWSIGVFLRRDNLQASQNLLNGHQVYEINLNRFLDQLRKSKDNKSN